MSKVGILLVLYNDCENLILLLKSLEKQVFRSYKVFAIETSSSGNSLKLLKEKLPDAQCYNYRGNLGYARANNFLAAKAIKFGCEYLLIINTDVVLGKKTIETLTLMISLKDEYVFSAPIVFLGTPDNGNGLQCYNIKVDYNKCKMYREGLNHSIDSLPECIEQITPPGCCFLIRTSAVNKIGLFNEENFMYTDEIDLSYRIHLNGFKGVASKKAKVWHNHDWSRKNRKGHYLEYFYITRNSVLFFYRYKMYFSLIRFILVEVMKFPLIIYWGIKKKGGLFVYYYYLGLFNGVIKKKGMSNVRF